MSFRIRQGTPEDIPILHKFIVDLATYEKEPNSVASTPDDLLDHFSQKPKKFDFIVGEVDDQIQGIAIFYEAYSTWRGPYIHLEDLIVGETSRGKGLGKALFLEVSEIARRSGSKKLTWEVLDWNKPAVDFYRHLGAEISKEWWNGTLYFD
ncbi:MAG: GNAT family N-acetyltransferase [Flavobacteriales bacterium]|jgi:GNAT superfamily N-acetyltransferase|nr:GNAT family N-acetyltransferase [Flavobacteriales bacterium]NCG29876.1 GNAT family N-acetyltransferase [Bacteroidota bacterium]MBT3963490.1 GNAT family N-acetyltransferase [Flavobacteriales bacterium]MBT4705124.1 GNAT family N-acetyltransferase [Flavobacteriales bacterium]MBT4930144.1 GNAT family N-acetyltransferase [Flavobacteriales bacterium]